MKLAERSARDRMPPASLRRGALLSFAMLALLGSITWADLASYTQRFSTARADYFRGLEGERIAESRASEEFAALERERPQDAEVLAYAGSLQLLEAAHTWALWNKHKLASEGLSKLDRSLQLAPENLEVRFIHAATTWHLPFFYHRKEEAQRDFAYIAPRAEKAAAHGTIPSPLAAAALDYYGQILDDRSDKHGAEQAYLAAVRIDRTSPGGQDASRRLKASQAATRGD